jgi:hypothetical protein
MAQQKKLEKNFVYAWYVDLKFTRKPFLMYQAFGVDLLTNG